MRMHSFSANQTCVIFSYTLLLKLCKFSLNSTCILVVSYRVNSPFLPYDLLEGRRIDDVTICFFCHTKKNTVYDAVGLFSNRLQKTLNVVGTVVTHAIGSASSATFMLNTVQV